MVKKRLIFSFEIGAGIVLTILALTFIWVAMLPTPDISSFSQRKIIQSTKIYDRTGEVLLYDLNHDIRRTVVPISDISPYLRNATVAIEDDQFYNHHGVRPISFLRAVLVNLTRGSFSQGGSTITQQVIKNSILTSDKTITRKIKEWFLAIKLENKYTKEQILESYLNDVPYGGVLYGAEEASQEFFGKDAKDLTLAEAAYMASIPQKPTYYSPYGSHLDELEKRKNLVLERMLKLGFIDESQYEEAKNEKVEFNPQSDYSIKAPHFVFYILEQIEKKYGSRAISEDGLKIITTLDYDLQKKAEDLVTENKDQLEENFGTSNEGIVAIDPKTGDILAMVGSRGYFDKEIDGKFNVTTALRQPGSTFKPFSYAEAISEGYTRNTLIYDTQTQFNPECGEDEFSEPLPCYSPNDFDYKFKGQMTFMSALAQSRNVPAVKVLYLAGMTKVINLAKNMGITTLNDPSRYGLSLAIGGAEVKLLDMTGAYGVFANKVIKASVGGIKEIQDKDGKILEERKPEQKRVLDEKVVNEINYMLSNNDARAPTFGYNSPLYFKDYDVAVKTGTTNDYRDAWVIGYSPGIVIGAWTGNNDNTPMRRKIGGYTIEPIWHSLMEYYLSNHDKEFFGQKATIPDTLKPILRGVSQTESTTKKIDTRTGLDADENTPPQYVFNVEIPGQKHSILYYIDKNNINGPAPTDPSQDPQYKNWEYSVENYSN